MISVARAIPIPRWLAQLCIRALLQKGAAHKYVRRVPTGNPKRPWKYYYNLTGGTGRLSHKDVVEGSKFKVADGHLHVHAVEGDHVEIVHDETGKRHRMHRDHLTNLLHDHHAEEVTKHQQRRSEVRRRRASKLPRSTKAIVSAIANEVGADFGAVDVEDQRVRDALAHYLSPTKLKRIKTFPDAVAALIQQAGRRSQVQTWRDLLDAKVGATESVFDILRDLGEEMDDSALRRVSPPQEAVDAMMQEDAEEEWAAYEEYLQDRDSTETEDPDEFADDAVEPEDGGDASWDFGPFSKGLLPDWIGGPLARDHIAKGAGHKYIRRVPYTDSKGRRRYRYFYRVTGGRHLGHDEEIKEGAAFRVSDDGREGHFHVLKVSGDKVSVRHDETGRVSAISRKVLREMLHREHAEAITRARRQAKQYAADAKKYGSRKQQERTRRRHEDLEAHFGDQEPGRIERVGDHIWGSRKDLAQLGEISVEDLDDLSSDDAAVLIRKSKLIDAPTLDEMREQGMSPGAAHMTLALLTAIKAKPDNTPAARAAYLGKVREIQGALKDVKTFKDIDRLIDELRSDQRAHKGWESVDGGLPSPKAAHDRVAELEKQNPGTKYRAVHNYMTSSYGVQKKTAKPYDALGAKFVAFIERYSSKTFRNAYRTARRVEDLRDVTYEGTDWGPAWEALQASTKEAKEAALKKKRPKATAEIEKVLGHTSRGTSKVKARTKVVRTGGVEVKDADPARIAKTFGLREIDYGEYLSQPDREHHTIHLEGALHDLMDVLDLPPGTISLGGRIGIALGARGSGNAKAHYEPGRKAINITKFKGGGSVAHEWGHAMDNIVSEHYVPGGKERSEPFLSIDRHNPSLPADLSKAVGDVMEAILKHPDPEKARSEIETLKRKAASQVNDLIRQNNEKVRAANEIKALPTPATVDKAIAIQEAYIKQWEGEKAKGTLSAVEAGHRDYWIKKAKEKIDTYRSTGGRTAAQEARFNELQAEVESLRTRINAAKREEKKVRSLKDHGSSEFVRNAVAAGPYWARTEELFARAFETYVHEKLKRSGRENSYLVDGEKMSSAQPWAYPQGEELERVMSSMDALLGVVRGGGHLEKALGIFDEQKEGESMNDLVKADMLHSHGGGWIERYKGTSFHARALAIEEDSMREVADLNRRRREITSQPGCYQMPDCVAALAQISILEAECRDAYESAKEDLAIAYVAALRKTASDEVISKAEGEEEEAEVAPSSEETEKACGDLRKAYRTPEGLNVVVTDYSFAKSLAASHLQTAQDAERARRAIRESQVPRTESAGGFVTEYAFNPFR